MANCIASDREWCVINGVFYPEEFFWVGMIVILDFEATQK